MVNLKHRVVHTPLTCRHNFISLLPQAKEAQKLDILDHKSIGKQSVLTYVPSNMGRTDPFSDSESYGDYADDEDRSIGSDENSYDREFIAPSDEEEEENSDDEEQGECILMISYYNIILD